MAKYTPTTVNSGYNSASAIDDNFQTVATELNDKVLYRDNPVGEPNSMQNDLDMNSNDVLNVNNVDAQDITIAGTSLTTQVNAAATSASNAATSEANAATSETNAAASSSAASSSAAAAAASASAGLYKAVVDIAFVDSPYAVTNLIDGNLVQCDTTGGNITVTLPDSTGETTDMRVAVGKMTNDANTITVQRSGTDTVNGGTDHTITAQYEVINFILDQDDGEWLAAGGVVGGVTASNVTYNNSTSGLTATDGQAAIDEVEGRVDTAETDIIALQARPRKNYIINPRLEINQRGFAGGALTAGDYGFDRWKARTGDANLSRSGDTVTITSGGIEQVIENPYLEGKTITISALNGSGTITGYVDGAVTSTSGTLPLTVTLAAGDNTNITIGVSGASVTFDGIQVEVGSAATDFEFRYAGEELTLCRRYYQTRSGQISFAGVYRTTPSAVCNVISLVPTMRTTPTLTYGTVTGAALATLTFTAATPVLTLDSAPDSFTPYINDVTSANDSQGTLTFDWTADAEL